MDYSDDEVLADLVGAQNRELAVWRGIGQRIRNGWRAGVRLVPTPGKAWFDTFDNTEPMTDDEVRLIFGPDTSGAPTP